MGASSSQENDEEHTDEDLNLIETSDRISKFVGFEINNVSDIYLGLKVRILTILNPIVHGLFQLAYYTGGVNIARQLCA